MAHLHKKISQLMTEKNITATDIERITGINRNTVYSIVAGNSKNPSANNLQLIAKALDVNIDTFLSDEFVPPAFNLSREELICYKETTTEVIGVILDKKININLLNLVSLIKEVYEYSLKSTPPNVDKRFIDWLIDKQHK